MIEEHKDKKEQQLLAVTRLELEFDKFITKKKKEILYNPMARSEVERMLYQYMLNPDTVGMFATVGMTSEYTTLINKFNKLLDGDLT